MIQEAYVSFEVAKLLKEKGFDQETTKRYNPSGELYSYYQNVTVIPKGEAYVCAPTQQMAMRWLREEHKINIEVRMLFDSWDYCVQRIPNHEGAIYQAEDIWKSYEAACNAALYYCVDNLTED